MAESQRSETPADFKDEGKRWEAELDAAQKPEDGFRKIAKDIEKRYRDEEEAGNKDQKRRRFNILWYRALYGPDWTRELHRQWPPGGSDHLLLLPE